MNLNELDVCGGDVLISLRGKYGHNAIFRHGVNLNDSRLTVVSSESDLADRSVKLPALRSRIRTALAISPGVAAALETTAEYTVLQEGDADKIFDPDPRTSGWSRN